MSEHRKALLSMLIKRPGDTDTSTKIEVFPAAAWHPEYPTTDAYRLRIDGQWHDGEHAATPLDIPFLTWAAVMSVCSKIGANLINPDAETPPKVTPDMIRRGCRVRLSIGWGEALTRPSYAQTTAYQNANDDWMVNVVGEGAVPLSRIVAVEEGR